MAEQMNTHKIRARMKDGMAEVKMLLQHPMETGNRKDPETGLKIPRHFIRELTCEHHGNAVLSTQWSWGIARNPYLALRIREASPGDRVRVYWSDDTGATDEVETILT